MKIEIAENMLYSWLRHCKKCQIVQTNFKASKEWMKFRETEIENIFQRYQEKDEFKGCQFVSKNQKMNFKSVINASECDLVGVHFDDETIAYAIESAFHENGMHYKNNRKKVLQKIFRNYLMLSLYFRCDKIELIFATPLVKGNDESDINSMLENLKNFLNTEHLNNVKIDFIANGRYKSEIIDSLYEVVDGIADSSELFVRSIKLDKLMHA